MFTYGYIREAAMAHMDISEEEAQDMHLFSRFHIFANEAMQAICASKPKYQYIEKTVVEEYAPLVIDEGGIIRLATEDEINWNVEEDGEPTFNMLDAESTKAYYNEKNIIKQFESISMTDTFIAFADKQAWKYTIKRPSPEELLSFDESKPSYKLEKDKAIVDSDFAYLGKNTLKFYKVGKYEIPAKFMWYRFQSDMSDSTELDMPSDILLTIPLYIAAVCLQIDNPQRAAIKRSEFEMALARCTATDFMTLNEIKSTW